MVMLQHYKVVTQIPALDIYKKNFRPCFYKPLLGPVMQAVCATHTTQYRYSETWRNSN